MYFKPSGKTDAIIHVVPVPSNELHKSMEKVRSKMKKITTNDGAYSSRNKGWITGQEKGHKRELCKIPAERQKTIRPSDWLKGKPKARQCGKVNNNWHKARRQSDRVTESLSWSAMSDRLLELKCSEISLEWMSIWSKTFNAKFGYETLNSCFLANDNDKFPFLQLFVVMTT